MFKRNTAVSGFPIGHFIQTADGAAKTTGTPTCKRLLDGTPGALTNAASYDGTAGVWKIDLAAGDMDGDMVGLSFTLADCLPISYAIRTSTSLVSDVETDTADIQNRLPGVLVNGRIIADSTAIGNSQAAADAIKAMVTGVGTTTLSLAELNVVANSAAPAVTISNAGTGNAVKLQTQSGDVILVEQLTDGNNCAIKMSSAGTGVWIDAANDNGIEITTNGVNAVGLMINSYKYAMTLASEIGEAIHISTNVNGKPAVYIYHYGANPGPAVKLESVASAGLEVKGAVAGSDILLSGSGKLSAILSALGIDAITAAAIAADAGVEIADAVRTELAVELAHLDADVSTAGGLTAQETANAVHNLLPVGTPATGSIGAKINLIDTNVDAIKAVTDALDVSAVTQVAASNAGHLTITVGLTFDEGVTGLTIPADWVTALWTLKNNARDADTAAIVQLRATNPAAGTDGLQRLNGAALVAPITADDGALTVTQATGRIDVYLTDDMTAQLAAVTTIGWDVKFIDEAGDSSGQRGTADVVLTETRATT